MTDPEKPETHEELICRLSEAAVNGFRSDEVRARAAERGRQLQRHALSRSDPDDDQGPFEDDPDCE